MTTSRFTNDPSRVKQFTNPSRDGASRSQAPQSITGGGNHSPYYDVSVKDKPGHGSDQQITHTGPGAGTMGGIGGPTDVQGFISATGNKIIVDNTFGADTITLQHHSGATIMIDVDGSIHMISSGKKGVGMIAPRGDATVFAAGHLILKGNGRITVESAGDLDFNVGGDLNFHVDGNMTSIVKGNVEEVVDGGKIVEVVKHLSTTVAGDNRTTVAGNMQTQVNGNLIFDTQGDLTTRSDGALSLNTQKTLKAIAKALISIDTKDTITVTSTGNMTLQSAANFETKSSGTTKASSTGDLSLNGSAGMGIWASGEISINGSDTVIQTSGSPSVDSVDAAATAPLAQYAPANTIIDSITTIRVAPDFPLNTKRLSKEDFSRFQNENQHPNPKAEAAATPNTGSGIVPEPKDTGIQADPPATTTYDKPAGATSNGVAEQNPLPVPTSVYNANAKLSKHFTIGHMNVVQNIKSCPENKQQAVIKAAMHTAWNILDPLVEKYGSRVQVTSWWRAGTSVNHVVGDAVDLRAANKNDVALTAEIAAFVRDNLPYDQVFLEANDSPGIHCHVRAAPVGQKGGGKVYTCADKHCSNKVDGIQLKFAVAALNSGESSRG